MNELFAYTIGVDATRSLATAALLSFAEAGRSTGHHRPCARSRGHAPAGQPSRPGLRPLAPPRATGRSSQVQYGRGMECHAAAIWDERYLAYDFGDHPLNPIRLDLTIRWPASSASWTGSRSCAPDRRRAGTADIHDADYLDAVRAASNDPRSAASASAPTTTRSSPACTRRPRLSPVARAPPTPWTGAAEHAVNIAGGLHHAMRGYASGFCVFNDVVLGDPHAARRGRAAGRLRRHRRAPRRRRAGRVLRRPAGADDQPAPGPAHAVPGHRPAHRDSARARRGHRRSTSRCRRAPDDAAGCARSARSCPARCARSRPDVLVTQCGCDTHHEDPLANLELYRRRPAHGDRRRCTGSPTRSTGGRWVAFGGGGYGLVRCVPRTWTHLLAEASAVRSIRRHRDPAGVDDARARARRARRRLPSTMGEAPTGSRGSSRGSPAASAGWTARSAPPGGPRSRCSASIPDDPRD